MSVPDSEIAQEIVKVHTFMPAKIKDSELKMIHLKQCIGLSTPVGLSSLTHFSSTVSSSLSTSCSLSIISLLGGWFFDDVLQGGHLSCYLYGESFLLFPFLC